METALKFFLWYVRDKSEKKDSEKGIRMNPRTQERTLHILLFVSLILHVCMSVLEVYVSYHTRAYYTPGFAETRAHSTHRHCALFTYARLFQNHLFARLLHAPLPCPFRNQSAHKGSSPDLEA